MVQEAPLEQTESGLVPKGEGWFVVNAKEARWLEHQAFGSGTTFEGEPEFQQLGINIGVLEPGQPACLYHRENAQEDFLVLFGDALLIVEGDERPLRQWDFVHCPAGTKHIIVGAGAGSSGILAVGARERQTGPGWGGYTVDEAALRHGAGVDEETTEPEQAYAPVPKREPTLRTSKRTGMKLLEMNSLTSGSGYTSASSRAHPPHIGAAVKSSSSGRFDSFALPIAASTSSVH